MSMYGDKLETNPMKDDVAVNMDVAEEEYDWINSMLMNDDSVPISLNEVLSSSSDTADSNFSFNGNDLYHDTKTDQDFFSMLDNIKEEDLFSSMDEEEDPFVTWGIVKKAEGIRGGIDQQSGNSMTTFNCDSSSKDISNALNRKSSNYVNSYGSTNIIITATTRQEGLVVPSAPHNHGRELVNWVLVGPDILPRAEFCPASIKDYLRGATNKCSKKIDHNSITTKVRMHLSYLGWKIECSKRDGATRNSRIQFRYTSPDNKAFYSLADVCRNIALRTTSLSHNSVADTKKLVTVDNKDGYASGVRKLSGGESIVVRNIKELANAHIKPKYCPQAMIAWVNFKCGSDISKQEELRRSGGSATSMALQAKEHLRAVGWDFYYYMKPGNKKELRYRSPLPPNTSFSSLVTACKRCMKDNELSETKVATNGFVCNENPKGCREGFLSFENNSNGSKGIKTSATVSPRIDSNPLPVDWQPLKGYYTEPLDTLDLEELNEEY